MHLIGCVIGYVALYTQTVCVSSNHIVIQYGTHIDKFDQCRICNQNQKFNQFHQYYLKFISAIEGFNLIM